MTRSKELRNIGPEIDALRQGMDWHPTDLDRPQILVENTQGSSHPGSSGLDQITAEVNKGVMYGQGKPANFTVTDICDGIAQGHEGMSYSLVSREIIAGMVEIHAKVNPVDGMVLISACDKAIPAHLIAAARLNLPTIHVPGGTMMAGPDGLTLEQIGTYAMQHHRGEITDQQFSSLKAAACPSTGACQFMGTAGTMQVMAEALGLALPGTAVAPQALKAIKDMAREAGGQITKLVEQGIRARDILTYEAFYNAIVVHAAISGSTNALIHLPAIAREAGVQLDSSLFDEIHRRVPFIVNTRPAGKYATEYFWYAGGVPKVMLELQEYLNLDVMTCTGRTLGENLELIKQSGWIENNNGYLRKYGLEPQELIYPKDKPIQKEGAIAILTGNLAPQGSVVKHSAVSPDMHVHVGPARVFHEELAARQAVLNGDIKPGDVVVVPYNGPKGAGMPEMFYTTEAIASDPKLIATTAIITDGRYSGATRGPAIGHVSPEAAEGGPIALVEDGDLIRIDIPNRSLAIVGIKGQEKNPGEIEGIFAQRKEKWLATKGQEEVNEPGILGIFKKLATSGMAGGYMK